MDAGQKPHGAGKSSFEFVDLERVLQILSLTPTTVLVDLGCGRGNYTIPVAEAVGPEGKVYGVDAWQEGLDGLRERASAKGLHNIITIHGNLNEHIPLEDALADICFMGTVLHDLLRERPGDAAMKEIARVLKPAGKLHILEFKKVSDGPGPPIDIRLSAEETEGIITPFGFTKDRVTDLGPFHYILSASLAARK